MTKTAQNSTTAPRNSHSCGASWPSLFAAGGIGWGSVRRNVVTGPFARRKRRASAILPRSANAWICPLWPILASTISLPETAPWPHKANHDDGGGLGSARYHCCITQRRHNTGSAGRRNKERPCEKCSHFRSKNTSRRRRVEILNRRFSQLIPHLSLLSRSCIPLARAKPSSSFRCKIRHRHPVVRLSLGR